MVKATERYAFGYTDWRGIFGQVEKKPMATTSSFILQIETVAQKWCDANINETCIASAQHMLDIDAFQCQIMTADWKKVFHVCTRHQIEDGLWPHIALDLQYQLHRIFFPAAPKPAFTLDELNAAQDMIDACKAF